MFVLGVICFVLLLYTKLQLQYKTLYYWSILKQFCFPLNLIVSLELPWKRQGSQENKTIKCIIIALLYLYPNEFNCKGLKKF